MRFGKRRVLLTVLVLLLAAGIGSGLWLGDYYRAGADARAALESDETVYVTLREDGGVVFAPQEARRGLIFYPGGKVEHLAYAPLLRSLAEEGWLCVLPKMPMRLAVLDADAAAGVPEQYPEIESWYIGGHSLGGAMAASFAAEHTETFDGLILLAAYSTEDLTDSGLEVWSLYGSEDGVLNAGKYEEYRANLPADTREAVLEGGCHAGFGDYGVQDGDGEPSVTAMEQVRMTVELLEN